MTNYWRATSGPSNVGSRNCMRPPPYLLEVRGDMHSSLAVTTDGPPLGLCAIKIWSRHKFKGPMR